MRKTQAVKQALALFDTHIDIVFAAYICGKCGTIPVFITEFFRIRLKNCVEFPTLFFSVLSRGGLLCPLERSASNPCSSAVFAQLVTTTLLTPAIVPI